jgi:hypothetical protein
VRPISPRTGAVELVLAKDQPQYIPLPAALYHDSSTGSVELVTRWTLTDEERLAVAEGADIFLGTLTFDQPYQPVRMQVGPQHYQLPNAPTD